MIKIVDLKNEEEDIQFTFESRREPYIAKNFPSKPPESLTSHKKWLVSKLEKKDNFLYKIILKGKKKIGLCWLENIKKLYSAEFGLYLTKENSYGGEVVEVFLEMFSIGFEEYQLKEIYCETMLSNKPGINLQKRLEMDCLDSLNDRDSTTLKTFMSYQKFNKIKKKWLMIINWIISKYDN